MPNRVEGSNNIIIDGTGVVPFLRSSVGFQKLVIMKDSYPATKEVPHSMSQASGDCVVFKEQVEEQKEASNKKLSKEEYFGKLEGAHFEARPTHPAVVLYDYSAEELANSDSIDKLYTPFKAADKWGFEVPENAKECLVTMNNSLVRRYLLITASDGVHYVLYPVCQQKN